MKKITFSETKNNIIRALDKSLSKETFCCQSCGKKDFILVDGFINSPIQKALSGSIIVGGPSVPLIALACKKCGYLHHYALRVLLPELFGDDSKASKSQE